MLQLLESSLASAVGWRIQQEGSLSGYECLTALLAQILSYELIEEGIVQRNRRGKVWPTVAWVF
jgi:hypothetical protein